MDVKGIESILAQIRAASSLVSERGTVSRAVAAPAQGFGSVLKTTLNQVNGAQNGAARLAREFELGNPQVTLHETMIAMQKASISFQGTVQVRNKLVAAYHEIMNMQV